jgi:DNA mismatch repair protein MutL
VSEGRITQLSEQLANQIAAGEVVARPASVVKELLENAVDAGARHIRVELAGGGISLLRVVDDGHGIHPEDVALTLARHATSKLRSVDDLRTIATMGFRGEALASIASVSKLSLRTRRASDEEGTELRVEGGHEPSVRPCGCAPGTTVEVADLFYNVPARRKFLRAVATESAHVSDAVRSVALAHPSIQLELARDGRTIKRWQAMPALFDRVADVLSDYELWTCQGERGPIAVQAFLAAPERARSGAGGLHLFINHRPIRDRALARAVAQAYGEVLEPGRYPVGAVFIAMPAELVDVNVHPQKAEVRFAHARAVTDALYSVLTRSLAERLPAASGAQHAHGEPTTSAEEPWQWADSGSAATTATRPSAATDGRLKVLSLFQQRFAVCERADRLLIIDTERLRRQQRLALAEQELARGKLASQRLLFPARSEVDDDTASALEAASEAFERFGFDVRRSGEHAVTIHAAARLVASCAPERLLAEIVHALQTDAFDPDDIGPLFSNLVSLAIQAEPVPSIEEMYSLFEEMGLFEETGLLEKMGLVGAADDVTLGRALIMSISGDELLRQTSGP